MLNVVALTSAVPVEGPRVQIGSFTRIVGSAPEFDPLPPERWVAEPVYVYDHDAIDRDCDTHARLNAKFPTESDQDIEARRARLHRELDEQLLATCPPSSALLDLVAAEREAWARHSRACLGTDKIALGREPTDEEEAEYQAASDAQEDALQRVMSFTPTCPGDLVAMMNMFDEREMANVNSPVDGILTNLFASARAFLDPAGYGTDPDVRDVGDLFSEWHTRTLSFGDDIAGMSDDESQPIFDALCDLERSIDLAPPSPMRAAATALTELYHEVGDLNSPKTPASLLAETARNDLGRVCVLTIESLRPLLYGAVRSCVDELLDHPHVRLVDSSLHSRPRPTMFAQAAE